MKCSYCGKESSSQIKPSNSKNITFCCLECMEKYYEHPEETHSKNKMRGKKAQTNGAYFEKVVIAECERLQQEGKAVIRKLNEERVGVNKANKKQYAYKSQLWSDFIGYSNEPYLVDFPDDYLKVATFLAFECKSTDEDYFPFSNIAVHQLEFLHKLNQDGGDGFLLIYFANRDKDNVVKWYINESTYIMLSKTKQLKKIKGKYKEVFTKGINYNELCNIVVKNNIMNITNLEII